MTRERPILFSAPMVRALLDGTKSQTRRAWRNQPPPGVQVGWVPGETKQPYGWPGDRLWVRESLKPWTQDPALFAYAADDTRVQGDGYSYPVKPGRPYVASIHLARCWSRITLEITAVRVERLQEISEADAKAEGCSPLVWDGIDGTAADLIDWPLKAVDRPYANDYALLWEAINGDSTWAANPWVWVIEFRKAAS